jgi:hypothetical protein
MTLEMLGVSDLAVCNRMCRLDEYYPFGPSKFDREVGASWSRFASLDCAGCSRVGWDSAHIAASPGAYLVLIICTSFSKVSEGSLTWDRIFSVLICQFLLCGRILSRFELSNN